MLFGWLLTILDEDVIRRYRFYYSGGLSQHLNVNSYGHNIAILILAWLFVNSSSTCSTGKAGDRSYAFEVVELLKSDCIEPNSFLWQAILQACAVGSASEYVQLIINLNLTAMLLSKCLGLTDSSLYASVSHLPTAIPIVSDCRGCCVKPQVSTTPN